METYAEVVRKSFSNTSKEVGRRYRVVVPAIPVVQKSGGTRVAVLVRAQRHLQLLVLVCRDGGRKRTVTVLLANKGLEI